MTTAPADPRSPGSPWLDLGSTTPLSITNAPSTRDRRLASVLTLGGVYAGFITWTYFAWYNRPSHEFRWGGDGSWKLWRSDSWFSVQTYAAGADKMGHAWATMGLARAGTELLHQWGGYPKRTSALIGAALSEALFLGVEIKDGFNYRFSYGDFAFNTAGALFALASSLSPRFDELVDFRVQYGPSAAYRRRAADGDLDIAEDYSGQTYLLAFHLGAIHALRDASWGGWSRFVDVSVGFESRGYKPDPTYVITPDMPDYAKSQSTFVGLSLNAQGLCDYLLGGRSEGWRAVTHGAFEVYSLPYSALPIATRTRRPVGTVPDQQE